jgi:sugar phosphate isomerase/epimerase
VDEAFGALKPFIRHVHFHDGTMDADKLVFLPVGQGAYDHKRVLQLLRGMNYSGFISGEWINWEPPEVHLPRELNAIRAIEATL